MGNGISMTFLWIFLKYQVNVAFMLE